MSNRRVDVLVFGGCPNVDVAVANARAAVEATSAHAEVLLVHVETQEEAERLRFPGSPTVRVDGVDVDNSESLRDGFGLRCRVYSVDGRLQGAPPVDWILAALQGETREQVAVMPASGPGCCAAT